jgi:hypothetical protein
MLAGARRPTTARPRAQAVPFQHHGWPRPEFRRPSGEATDAYLVRTGAHLAASGDGAGRPRHHHGGQKVRRLMWVLVVFALNAQSAFSIPRYSSEQTCSAKGKEIVSLARNVKSGSWLYRCAKPE